jgi:predicted PurR-regulated permease PerM
MSQPWSSTTRLVVSLVLLALGISLAIWAFPMIQALLIAVLVAILLDPMVRWTMQKLHLSRALAASLVYFLLLLLIIAIPATFGTLAYSQIANFNTDLQSAIIEIEKWISQPVVLFGFDLSPRNIIQNFGASAGSALTSITGNTLNLITGVTTNFLWILFILVSLYYLLRDGPKIKPWLVSLVAPDFQDDLNRLLSEIDRIWGLFMRVQVLIFILLVVLFLMGSAMVVWLYQLGLIPFSTIGLIVMLVLVYTLVQQIDNLWLRPQILGNQLRLHPGVVFVCFIGALAIGGVLAAIVIVPILASLKVVGRYVRLKYLGVYPWPEDIPTEPSPAEQQTT